jgi:hypothetical protein
VNLLSKLASLQGFEFPWGHYDSSRSRYQSNQRVIGKQDLSQRDNL